MDSGKTEFVAVFGCRRVGKTYPMQQTQYSEIIPSIVTLNDLFVN